MATHSNILAWGIPWTEDPGWLQSTGSQVSDMTERLSTQPTLVSKNPVLEVRCGIQDVCTTGFQEGALHRTHLFDEPDHVDNSRA